MGSDKKWIYLSYIAATLLSAWVLNQVLIMAVGYLRLPNPRVLGVLPATAVVSFVGMVVAGFLYFRRPKVEAFSTEVMQELHKVTWPPRKNVYMSTIVVLITVMITAGILGAYDWLCTGIVGYLLKFSTS